MRPDPPTSEEAEVILRQMREKRARQEGRTVPNQGELIELLGIGMIDPRELLEDEHIAIFGLNYQDSQRENAALRIYWMERRSARAG
jgi:hypothetical protein